MLTIDAHLQAYERSHPTTFGVGTLYGHAEVTGDQMWLLWTLVDGTILV